MRYSGKLGYSEQTEKRPGVWEETITEVDVLGQVEQRTEVLSTSTSVLPEYTTTTSISVLALPDPKKDLVYVTYLGVRWSIGSVVTEFPKMRIFIGKEYHGPLPAGAPATP